MYLLQRRLEQGDAIKSLLADTKGELEEALLKKHRDAVFALKSNRRRRVKPLLTIFSPFRRSMVNRDYSLLLRPLGGKLSLL